MSNIRSSSIFLIIFFSSNTNATLPIYPAEIIARDLIVPGTSWAGHVGITTAPNLYEDAYQVIEALKEDPVLQTNTIANFKTRSPYWGSRYGISDRGANALRILREANFQKDLGCATYTWGVSYDVSTGSYDGPTPRPTHCGFFRCDTFVNYVFHWGNYTLPTYNPPRTTGNASIPKYVFNAFPFGNGDGPYAQETLALLGGLANTIKSIIDKPKGISINSIAAKQLADMNFEEIATVIDVPNDKIDSVGVRNLLKFAKDPLLTVENRTFIMDKLGFVGTVDMITDLIELYKNLKNINDAPIKNQIIATLQNIYQRHSMLEQQPHEKQVLSQFYLTMLDQELLAVEKSLVLRGFISLSSNEDIISNIDKIIAKINDSKNVLNPQTALKLKMEILNKSQKLEKLLLADMVITLQNENNTELDNIFEALIVYRLSHLGPKSLSQQSKNEISTYLDSIKFKYNIQNKLIADDGITLFSYGAWLEATALINSNSLKDAGSYIANYLYGKSSSEQEIYIIGLSNSDYMQTAFENEPVLLEFKNQNKAIYFDTVGMPKKL